MRDYIDQIIEEEFSEGEIDEDRQFAYNFGMTDEDFRNLSPVNFETIH